MRWLPAFLGAQAEQPALAHGSRTRAELPAPPASLPGFPQIPPVPGTSRPSPPTLRPLRASPRTAVCAPDVGGPPPGLGYSAPLARPPPLSSAPAPDEGERRYWGGSCLPCLVWSRGHGQAHGVGCGPSSGSRLPPGLVSPSPHRPVHFPFLKPAKNKIPQTGISLP